MEMLRGGRQPLCYPVNKQYKLNIKSNRQLPARIRAMSDPDKLQIVFISTEVAPWSKVGGLADVIYALPAALAARGHDVMSVAPRYQSYQDIEYTGIDVPLQLPGITADNHDHECDEVIDTTQRDKQRHTKRRGRRKKRLQQQHKGDDDGDVNNKETTSDSDNDNNTIINTTTTATATTPHHAGLYATQHRGVRRVFVDHPLLQTNDIYGSSNAALTYTHSEQYNDLDLRYSILCQASLAAAATLFDPVSSTTTPLSSTTTPLSSSPMIENKNENIKNKKSNIVFVANDWPTALQVLRLRYMYRNSNNNTITIDNDDDENFLSLHRLLQQQLATAVTAFCIHNLAYQGIFPSTSFPRVCLPHTAMNALLTNKDWREVMLYLSLPQQQQQDNNNNSEESMYQWHDDNNNNYNNQHCLYYNDEIGGGDRTMTTTTTTAVITRNTNDGDNNNDNDDISALQHIDTNTNTTNDGELNWMRGALLASDRIITVSPTYAQEIQSMHSMMGCGMEDILSYRGVTGIMNGIDTQEWNPSIDQHLPLAGKFTHHSFIFGKSYMKSQLQDRLHLNHQPDAVLVVFIGRLTDQKGVDVLLSSLPALMQGCITSPSPHSSNNSSSNTNTNTHTTNNIIHNTTNNNNNKIQIAMLGTGDPSMQAALDSLSKSYPGMAVGISSFSEELAHWMVAAADYVIVPSRFEPCGLVAQCGCRYGSVPIVTAVGGLKDLVVGGSSNSGSNGSNGNDSSDGINNNSNNNTTITSINTVTVTDVGMIIPPLSTPGDAFGRQHDVHHMIDALRTAEQLCGTVVHREMQRKCMTMDVSWDKPAEEWERVLMEMVEVNNNNTITTMNTE